MLQTTERRWLRVAIWRTIGSFGDVDVTVDVTMTSLSSVGNVSRDLLSSAIHVFFVSKSVSE